MGFAVYRFQIYYNILYLLVTMESLTEAVVQLNQIPKMIKVLSYRTGRYIYKPVEEYPTILSNRAQTRSIESGLHNPIVLASVAAGVIGVVIVIILIFTIWIQRRCYKTNNGVHHKTEYSATELDSISNSTIKSSTSASPDSISRSSLVIMTMVNESPRRDTACKM